MKRSDWIPLIGFIVLSQLAGVIGSFFTISSVSTWYNTLVRPPLNPPGWVFGPVWTTLYILMGLAAFLVWRRGAGTRKRRALIVFGLQLSLNALWSVVFFGMHWPLGALVVIVALWLSIVWTMMLFSKVSRRAVRLLWPYLAWVTFATYLNCAIWLLN